jgi:uncharacterized membrane protein YphA (DoxX/SURF4 family)
MRTALYGRVVFGASAVLFGVIALMWHDADTWQNLQHIWSLPFGTVIGGCLMIAQIAGGVGVLYLRTARLASLVLCVVYLCFSLACRALRIPMPFQLLSTRDLQKYRYEMRRPKRGRLY